MYCPCSVATLLVNISKNLFPSRTFVCTEEHSVTVSSLRYDRSSITIIVLLSRLRLSRGAGSLDAEKENYIVGEKNVKILYCLRMFLSLR